jgi:hypothetical protein
LVLRAPAAAGLVGLLAFAPSASASATRDCAAVSVTIPHTKNHGHAALNNLRASAVTCETARSIARVFLLTTKAPEHWHASTATVRTHSNGRTNTVSEVILTRGTARVSGDLAN